MHNTEDDTFRKLRQSSFDVLYAALCRASTGTAQDMLDAHNWTFEEYQRAYIANLSHDRR